jgi:DNA-directed RNA polymerase specialized sigma24 family protein
VLAWKEAPGRGREELSAEVLSDPQLAARFRRALGAVLRGRLRDEELSEEVTQEAMCSIHKYFLERGLEEYTDRGEDAFGGWLYGLCRRHIGWALANHRRRRRQPAGEPEWLSEVPCPRGRLSEGQYEQALGKVLGAVDRLPEPLRGVVCDDLAGLSCAESAVHRGITKNYVAVLRGRGRRQLLGLAGEHLG